ncbi:hypothetical protein [Cytobacillus dafuensis]|uniref:Uncharacterized protein n=1 Tax=Cytobacillus dafuensis TaxID=1742359 RepID=A0A5B8Z3X8_CYTDA|nr:hypothetical protein [Cytobacillus dafuensis]QED46993.1 hypothetical protein FSZ17_06880 [Cytobacillus dafuensis]
MKLNRHPRPTDHYDKQLYQVDEQICALLKQRKELSNNNPGFPPDDVISNWAIKYDLYEEYLNSLFVALRMEGFFKPRVEPTGFRKHLPVLKSIEIDDRFYSVTAIQQYENASIVQLHIDWDEPDDSPIDRINRRNNNSFELFISKQYDCWQKRAGGSIGHLTYNFVVSPPLPDDISEIDLVFKEYSDTLKDKPTGLEIVINLE